MNGKRTLLTPHIRARAPELRKGVYTQKGVRKGVDQFQKGVETEPGVVY